MARFTDVPEGHWAFGFVDYVAGKGIMNGTGDGKFGPYDGITREQFASAIYNAIGAIPQEYKNPFKDVAQDNPYRMPITALAALGVFTPDADGNFYPKRILNRGELVTTIAKAYKLGVKPGFESTRYEFKDLDGHWAKTFAKSCYTHGIVTDVEQDGNFRPTTQVSRGEVARAIYRTDFRSDAFIPAPLR